MQASAETTMATAGTADLYITKLEEMGDYAKLSADDQQEYRNVLTLLCDLIPDLAGYIDTTTGEIQGGTTALRGYAKAWQDSAKAQAYQEFMSDVSQQYNDVTKELYQNQLKLTEAQTKGEAASKGMDETYQKLLSTLGMTDDEFQKTYGSVSAIAGVHLDPEIADEVMDLRDSYEEYSNQQLEAAENEKVYQQAVDDGITKQGEAQQAIADAQTAYENLEAAQSGATSSASEGAAELGQAISDVTVEAQKLVEAYNTAYDAAEKSIGGQYEIWDKASSVSATSVDTLNKNLESQTTYWQDYNTNLDTLREKAGSIEGLSDMVAGFADGSKESVDAIAGMAQAAQDGGGKLETMVKNWQDLQQAQKDASGALADLTTDFSSKMDELAQKAGDTVDELDMSAEAAKNGKATVQAFIDSASNMLPDVQTAYAKIGTTAANALQSKLDKANTSGRARKTGAQATGTRNAEPGWTLVGEYGPEIVYMQGGEGVLNAAQTKDVLPALDDRYTDKVADVDLDAGVLAIYGAKGDKERLVGISDSMLAYMKSYRSNPLVANAKSIYFFPAPDGGFYDTSTIYDIFRKCLFDAGIPHRGRGKGPRLHDLRHSFAVHILNKWSSEGKDIYTCLPILRTALGHDRITTTEKYLRLVPEAYMEVTEPFNDRFHTITEVLCNEE